MKNSFFLVIPEQQKHPDLLASYEKALIEKWVSELPTANPSLSTRMFFDYLEELNTVEMPPQQRLEVLELLRPQFLTIEEYLRSRLILLGFPKGENEQKILNLLVALEKNFTISYWMALKELTRKDVGWFQGKTIALALQRTIKGLSQIVVTHYMMFLPIPDWVWIDLHSLYKLSVRLKKDSVKVTDSSVSGNKSSSADDCYKQVLMLSLADPSGLMQKEVRQVFEFLGSICRYITIEQQPVVKADMQCVILIDEDACPYFDSKATADSSKMFLDLLKFYKILKQEDKFSSPDEARFSSMHVLRNVSEKLPCGLYDYLLERWAGKPLKGDSFFSDRLDRHISIGLHATYALQNPVTEDVDDDEGELQVEENLEILAESFSDRELSCKFNKEGVMSIGSLVSFRKKNDPLSKRSLAIVTKLTMPKQDGHIVFEISSLTAISFSVEYLNLDADIDSEKHEALLYGMKTAEGERSFIIMESFLHKDEDILTLFMNGEVFPIVLGHRKNIGLGYWQFECRRIEERQAAMRSKKKGYDFI